MPTQKDIINGYSINIPGFVGIYKILLIAVLIFPWYVILSNKNISGTLFGYLIGNDFSKKCPPCNFDLSKCPACLEPKKQCPVVEPCPACPKPDCPPCQCVFPTT